MKTRMKSEDRRAAIVHSAIHVFAEKGFRGATTRELAAAPGVTEPILYQHFRTKGELYSGIIEAQAQQASKRVERLRPGRTAVPGKSGAAESAARRTRNHRDFF